RYFCGTIVVQAVVRRETTKASRTIFCAVATALVSVLLRQVLHDGLRVLVVHGGAVDLDHLRDDTVPLPGVAAGLHHDVVGRVTGGALLPRDLDPGAGRERRVRVVG